MSDLGLLSYYMGIEVKQGPDGIHLHQAAYANKLLERSGLSTCNPSASPMEARLKLNKSSEAEVVDAKEYRSIIGALCYLLHTRPKLTFTVGYLSRFMEEPQADHLAVVKRVLRYVAGTRDHGLHYTRSEIGRPALVSYSDADMAGDIDTHRSTSGVIYFLGGNPITWQLTKQKVVVLSTWQHVRQYARAFGWLNF
jgi:hypothetical protein